jgi:putative redox protein
MEPVVVRSSGAIRVDVTAGPHTFVVDEPSGAGGTDAGPTPYDLLGAALGACTSMTLQIVARREQIPLEGLELTIGNDRMHAKDCADCLTTAGYIHRFDVKLKFIGAGLTAAHKLRLAEVARRCPVYKTLTSEIRIVEEVIG